jgi:hypothetical protein
LLTFFGEAKKVSGCRAAPGNPRLIEDRKESTSTEANQCESKVKRENAVKLPSKFI